MVCTKHHKKGVGSIVGAVFFIAIALMAFISFQLITMYAADYQRSLVQYNQLNLERLQERLSIIVNKTSSRLDVKICNRSFETAIISGVWIIDLTNNNHTLLPSNIVLGSGECFNVNTDNINYNSSNEYLIKVTTVRGNIFSNITGG